MDSRIRTEPKRLPSLPLCRRDPPRLSPHIYADSRCNYLSSSISSLTFSSHGASGMSVARVYVDIDVGRECMLRFVAHRLLLLHDGFRSAMQPGDGAREFLVEELQNVSWSAFQFIAKASRGGGRGPESE